MYSLNISSAAEADLLNIYFYGVSMFGEAQAEKYYNELQDYFEFIAQNPYSFVQVNHIKKDYRRGVYKSHSIYYKINDKDVIIVSVVSQQDVKRWL